jgi:uncharacterized protein (TIGR03435 family)
MRSELVTTLLVCVPVLAQTPAPRFEVASIRPGSMKPVRLPSGMSVIGSIQGGPGTSDPELLRMGSVAPITLLMQGYGVKHYQISGPGWIDTTRYDITATVPAGATRQEFNLMLQNLLQDRFRLKLHHESKEFRAYNLVEAKGGIRLKDSVSTQGCSAGPTPVKGTCPTGMMPISGIAKSATNDPPLLRTVPQAGGFIATGRSSPIAGLAATLEGRLQGPLVIDKTGIAGNYNFRFEFASPDVGTSGDFSFPSIFTALEKELGLKLEATSVPMDVLVVDRIEPPTEN